MMAKNDSQALKRKREFYAGLDSSTDSENDDAPDPGRQASVQAMQKAAARKQSLGAKEKNSNGLPRSVSDSNLANNKTDCPISSSEQRPPTSSDSNGKLPASLMTRHTFAGVDDRSIDAAPSSSAAPKMTGKRKRENSINQVPEGQRIFHGLHFYFFPNTDRHPARKMRIAKALEYGATWEQDFNDCVTHVIIDKAMDFGLLTKFLKRDTLPANVVVVSENYPAECISNRVLLDPQQLQFKVKGYDIKSAMRPASFGSDRSLELKGATKSVMARQPETPPTAENRAPTQPGVVSSEKKNGPSLVATTTTASVEEPLESKVHSTEELDAAIQQARELQDVPLDQDDEGNSRPTSAGGPPTDDEPQAGGQDSIGRKKTKFQSFQDKFQCMQKHTGAKTETPNAATIAILQQMADYYGQIGDEWRIRAYRKAMATLRNHPSKVWTKEEALALPQIGDRLATKIEEIAFTNRLRRLESARAEPNDQILQTFMGVYGAGFAQASKWVSAGYSTLDDLLAKADLSPNQRIGIEHYEDFHSRIPRAEVEQHGAIVRRTLQKIDPAFQVIIGGSYRRGADTSGDIDCIITRPDTSSAHIRHVVLHALVPQLFAQNFLVASLATTSRSDAGSKWHGASQLGTTHRWRRIDLLLVPPAELGAALIYFTGNDIFNRSLRLLAGTKGMRLNQRGLYRDVIRGRGREKVSRGVLVEGRDEGRIFAVLGVPWRPPEHRVC